MKKFFLVLHEHIHWLISLLLCDAFFVGMLWVVDARSLVTLSLALVLFTILSFAAVCAFLWDERSGSQELFPITCRILKKQRPRYWFPVIVVFRKNA